jgi:hypothetical protein
MRDYAGVRIIDAAGFLDELEQPEAETWFSRRPPTDRRPSSIRRTARIISQ